MPTDRQDSGKIIDLQEYRENNTVMYIQGDGQVFVSDLIEVMNELTEEWPEASFLLAGAHEIPDSSRSFLTMPLLSADMDMAADMLGQTMGLMIAQESIEQEPRRARKSIQKFISKIVSAAQLMVACQQLSYKETNDQVPEDLFSGITIAALNLRPSVLERLQRSADRREITVSALISRLLNRILTQAREPEPEAQAVLRDADK